MALLEHAIETSKQRICVLDGLCRPAPRRVGEASLCGHCKQRAPALAMPQGQPSTVISSPGLDTRWCARIFRVDY